MISTDALFSQRLVGLSTNTTTASAATVAPATTEASGQDFAQVLKSLAGETYRSMQVSEQTAVAQLRGHGSVQQTVEAIMRAEQNLQAAIAIRDKAVAAYQELSRMAI